MTSIQVAVRVRPFNGREIKYSSSLIIDMKGLKNTEVFESRGGKVNTVVPPRKFNFDYCFWTHSKEDAILPSIDPSTRDITDNSVLSHDGKIYADQKFVYSQLGLPILDNCLKGFNACLFAYGQTGSGKTYTMMGVPSDPGVTPQMCDDLFHRAQRLKDTVGTTITVTCSYMEIYNEIVRDLLNPSTIDLPGGLKVRQHPTLGVFVQDLQKLQVNTAEEVYKLLEDGGRVRAVAATNMNACSSRSHAILTLTISIKDQQGSELGSLLNLVDLAGSERAGSTGAEGATLIEGANINKSLTTLGMCLSRLADATDSSKNKQHIPYRDSQLTWLLNDSLGGNSKTAMLANISPASINYEETLSTLRFAMTVKKIKNNAVINEDPQQRLIRELRAEIEEIKVKILELEEGGFGEGLGGGGNAGGGTPNRGRNGAGNGAVADDATGEGDSTVGNTEASTEEGSDSAEDQLEKLELAARLIEEAQESPAEKAKKAAAAKAEHESAMQALQKNGVFVDNSAPRLVTLNEDLHTLPSVALMYYLKDSVNRIGSGNDKRAVLVRLPQEVGRERISLFHAVIEVDLLAKRATIRVCGESEQPEDMAGTSEATLAATTRSTTARRGSMSRANNALHSLANSFKTLNLNIEDGTYNAPVFINGQVVLPTDAPLELKHKDRIVIGSIAFRHSQPPNWYIEGLDDEFSRTPHSIEHAALLEKFARAEIEIQCHRELETLGKNMVSMIGGDSEVENATAERISLAIEVTVAAQLAELLDVAAEDENRLVERYPIPENEIADRAAKAAAKNSGIEYDYNYAIQERDDVIRRIILEKESSEREEQLSKLKEQTKVSEQQIERLKQELAQQEKTKAEAQAVRQEKDEAAARETAKNHQKQKEASEKTSTMLMLANELQMYEEQVRIATMWKPTGPSSTIPSDVEEYKLALSDPTFQAISQDTSPEKALVMPPIQAWKLRLEHGVLGRLRSGWHRVFILVRPRFIYYFNKNEPKQAANGAAYLFGCQLNFVKDPVDNKPNVMRIIPCVPRKASKSSKGETEDNNVMFAFDTSEDLLKVRLHIEAVYRPACPPRVAEFLRKQDSTGGGKSRDDEHWELVGDKSASIPSH